MKNLIACLTILIVFAAPATACLNDRELPSHEREFRSQYNRQTNPPAPAAESTYPGGFPLMIGGGAVLLIGAISLAANGNRTRE